MRRFDSVKSMKAEFALKEAEKLFKEKEDDGRERSDQLNASQKAARIAAEQDAKELEKARIKLVKVMKELTQVSEECVKANVKAEVSRQDSRRAEMEAWTPDQHSDDAGAGDVDAKRRASYAEEKLHESQVRKERAWTDLRFSRELCKRSRSFQMDCWEEMDASSKQEVEASSAYKRAREELVSQAGDADLV
jgi:hypothetical protein